jgi:copper chaperone CopZ
MAQPVEGQEIIYAIIITALIISLIFAIKAYIKQLKHNFTANEKELTPTAAEQNSIKTVYLFTAVISVKGMSDGKCAKEIENVLNSIGGLWASANLVSHSVTIRMKKPTDEKMLCEKINSVAGCEAESVVFESSET